MIEELSLRYRRSQIKAVLHANHKLIAYINKV